MSFTGSPILPRILRGLLILYCSLASLASAPNTSLLGMQRLLIDPVYRAQIIHHVRNPILQAFWRYEFDTWSERYRLEAIAPVQNKIGQLFASPLLCNVLCIGSLLIRDSIARTEAEYAALRRTPRVRNRPRKPEPLAGLFSPQHRGKYVARRTPSPNTQSNRLHGVIAEPLTLCPRIAVAQ